MPASKRVFRATMTMTLALVASFPATSAAQQSVRDVLSFLLTNRSIPTDDFVQDASAAAATAGTISDLLLVELATVPVGSSASGFIYRLNPALGVPVRSSDSFGPIFLERSLTSGAGRASFTLSYQTITYDSIDGRPLRDGSLVSVAARLVGDPQPFDVETVSLNLRSNTVLISAGYGITDRLDVAATLPMVRLTLDGQRVDTYRGSELVQATATASVSGIADAALRAKFNVFQTGGSGLAIGGEVRLPTGDAENLLGTGETTLKPRVVGSLDYNRFAVHGDLGYTFGGLSGELDYGGAVTMAATPRVTIVGELAARRLSIGRLAETTQTHPSLTGVETVRLTGVPETTHRAMLLGGVKWNVAGSGILSGHLMRPFTTAGLTSRWVFALTFDYSFEY
jgi:hypothetical protein